MHGLSFGKSKRRSLGGFVVAESPPQLLTTVMHSVSETGSRD